MEKINCEWCDDYNERIDRFILFRCKFKLIQKLYYCLMDNDLKTCNKILQSYDKGSQKTKAILKRAVHSAAIKYLFRCEHKKEIKHSLLDCKWLDINLICHKRNSILDYCLYIDDVEMIWRLIAKGVKWNWEDSSEILYYFSWKWMFDTYESLEDNPEIDTKKRIYLKNEYEKIIYYLMKNENIPEELQYEEINDIMFKYITKERRDKNICCSWSI